MTLLAALDIETTGIDPDEDLILEISWVITDEDFNTITPLRTAIVRHNLAGLQDVWLLLRENDVVRNMHQQSGLLLAFNTETPVSMEALAMMFCDDVKRASIVSGKFFDDEVPQVHLTGNSIAFDREFLKRNHTWANFFDSDVLGIEIHHRLLDLSSVKMMLDSAGVAWKKAENPGPHRAANDVLEVVEQGQIFHTLLAELKGNN